LGAVRLALYICPKPPNMHPLIPLAEKYGTPCYVYFKDIIERNFLRFQPLFDHVHYAVKANDSLAILQTLARLNAGFDIVSGGELAKVLRAGGDPAKVVFSGVGKQETEIEAALEKNIGCFNVESLFELHQIQQLAKKLNKRAAIAFRVNPDIAVETHPYITTGLKENKFGIPYREAERFYAIAKTLSHIEIKGIACHLGSLIFSKEPYLAALQKLLALDIEVSHIDIGGGFGVDKEKYFDSESLSREVKKITDKPIWVEPGRAIVAESGMLLTKVISIKSQEDKHFAIVDAGMNDFMRPCLYGAYHDIINLMPEKEAPKTYDIVGPVCETSDFFGKNRHLSILPNDILAITMAGAYGFCMSSHYNARPRAAEVMIDGEKDYLIRERENLNDLMAKEKCLP